MQAHTATAAVTLLAALVYLWMSLQVGAARQKTGIQAPAMTGDPTLERAVRVQMNTLEWMPIFLPGLWLFAFAWGDYAAATLGVVWIIGRIIYALSYMADPSKRTAGFGIQGLAALVLVLGALGKLIYALATGA